MDELEYLIKRADEDIEKLKDYLASGAATDHATYLQIVGRIEGIGAMKLTIEELAARTRTE